jgi:homotetrameric cytidine deaminase
LDEQNLIDAALAVRQNAYARYSNYRVGAALLDDRGKLYAGCNVENAAYPEGICAEAGAIAAMIAGGGELIHTIVIAGGHDDIEDSTCRRAPALLCGVEPRLVLRHPFLHIFPGMARIVDDVGVRLHVVRPKRIHPLLERLALRCYIAKVALQCLHDGPPVS